MLILLPKRAIAAGEAPDFTIPVYSMHTIFVLVAPSVFAASIYMCLGRIILITDGEQHSVIRGKWLTKIFVIGDVVSFVMQGGGKCIINCPKTQMATDFAKVGVSWHPGALMLCIQVRK